MKNEKWKRLIFMMGIPLLFVLGGCAIWSGSINLMLPGDSRPEKSVFPTEKIDAQTFDKTAKDVSKEYPGIEFNHIERFREAGILEYDGPSTCLQCHKTMTVTDYTTGKKKTVDLMEDVLSSSHYKFYTTEHKNVWGFNGELADDFPMGKINRGCPKPGSFAMTAWAELVVTSKGDTFSEGCGQCHIGGQHQAPLGEIMPGYKPVKNEKEGVDCLICHSVAYDMNKRHLVPDGHGFYRWGQDRSMKAAMTVTRPKSQACLRCHQHNFGGDIYIDEKDPSFMESMLHPGYKWPRIKHPGSKRGTPFSPSWDVHAAAGVECIDCHVTEGHKIAKGMHTTTMMTNDLPNIDVACENCHTSTPHAGMSEYGEYYDMHTEKIACQTCHITSLQEDNATMRDFSKTMYEEEYGVYIYTDVVKETQPGKAMYYTWWNGDCTFLGNPVGDNPNGAGLFRFYDPQHIWPEYKDFDYAGWFEKVMRPIADKKPSKLYVMKIFNGKQHVDLHNMGPFGAMFVPYNLPIYYKTGDPDAAATAEMQKSMMKKMYGFMFDTYMMDKFMSFMDVDGWSCKAYGDVAELKGVEPRWIPADAGMEISHAIRREGALTCDRCHSEDGVLDWKALGYTPEEVAQYTVNPLE